MTEMSVHISGGVQLDPNSEDGIAAGVEGGDPPGGGCDCGITDSFTRTVSGGWGTSDAGIPWSTGYPADNTYVADGRGYLRGVSPYVAQREYLPLDNAAVAVLAAHTIETYFEFQCEDVSFYNYTPLGQNQAHFRRLLLRYTLRSADSNSTYFIFDINGSNMSFNNVFSENSDIAVHRYNYDATPDYIFNDVVPAGWNTGVYRCRFKADYTNTWLKLWQGDTEPEAWTLIVQPNPYYGPMPDLTDGSAWSPSLNFEWASWYQIGITGDVMPDGVFIDNVSVWVDGVLLDRCGAVQFDDFNRTVASGWGTATPSGYVWQAFTSGTQKSIDGARGLMTYSAYPSATQVVQDAYVSAAGPWISPTVFSVLIDFQIGDVDTTNVASFLVQYVHDGGLSGGQVMLEISSVNGRVFLSGGSPVAKTDWVANGSYRLRLERDWAANVMRARVWLAGATEPDTWLATGTAANGQLEPDSWFWISWSRGRSGTLNQGPSRTLYIDSIDFDYDGKPCYYDCSGCGITDTFTRTVSGGWGTSDAGIPWQTLSGSPDTDGSSGIIASATADAVLLDIGFVDVLDLTFEWVAGATVFGLNTDSHTTFTFRGPGATNPNQLAITTTSDFVFTSFTFTATTRYTFRAYQDSSSTKVKAWVTGTAEPGTWTLEAAEGGTPFKVQYVATIGSNAIDNLDITGVTRCTTVQFDDEFDRTVTSGWGTSPSGLDWGSLGPGGAVYKVEGGYGKGYQDGLYTSGQARIVIPTTAGDLADIVGNFTMTAKFQWYNKPEPYTGIDLIYHANSALLFIALACEGAFENPDQGIAMYVRNPFAGGADTISFVRFDDNTTTYITHPWTEGVWYDLKWERSDGGATNRIKVWPDGTSEPGWLVVETGDTPAQAGRFQVFRQGPTLAAWGDNPEGRDAVKWEDWWDYIRFAPGVSEGGSGCVPIPPGGGGGGGGEPTPPQTSLQGDVSSSAS